jgi:hypothetical protein
MLLCRFKKAKTNDALLHSDNQSNRESVVPLLLHCDRPFPALVFSISWLRSYLGAGTLPKGGCAFKSTRRSQVDPACPDGSKLSDEIAKGRGCSTRMHDGALSAYLTFGDCVLARKFLTMGALGNRHTLSRILSKTPIPGLTVSSKSCVHFLFRFYQQKARTAHRVRQTDPKTLRIIYGCPKSSGTSQMYGLGLIRSRKRRLLFFGNVRDLIAGRRRGTLVNGSSAPAARMLGIAAPSARFSFHAPPPPSPHSNSRLVASDSALEALGWTGRPQDR